jgi:hypothetical protein
MALLFSDMGEWRINAENLRHRQSQINFIVEMA